MQGMIDIIFISLGLIIWQAGLLATIAGILLIKARTESVLKLAGLMSLMTDMKYIRKIKSIVEPVNRSTKLGVIMLVAGAGLMVIGGAIIKGFI